MIFKKADWIYNTDVYEVNVRQYSAEGTFNAFAKELPRLKDMGVSTLWFMPITPIAQKNKKGSMGSPYACSDYVSINPEFGTLNDFKAVVDTAHDMEFKVIIDWVANHTGWDHVWTKTHPSYFKTDILTNDFQIASGMDDIIELDFNNPELRRAMIDAMEYWVKECDIDGFRCDLAFWVPLDFWLQAREALEKTKQLFWLAESDPLENPTYYQAFDACYTWTWMHKTEDFYKNNQDIRILNSLLHQYQSVAKNNGLHLWFTANHDENSWNGSEYEKYGDAAKAFTVHNFTWDGIPLIYSGQERPNLKRLQFFEKDAIEWNGRYELHDFYKVLLQLRKTNPALNAGSSDDENTISIGTSAENNVLSWLRQAGDRKVLVLINMSSVAIEFTFDNNHLLGNFRDVFDNTIHNFTNHNSIGLQAWGYRVFEI